MSRTLGWIAVIVAIVGASAALWLRHASEEAVVERRLYALAAEITDSTSDGRGVLARAAQLGTYFTEDVTIDLGPGSAPIHGRETVLDMLSRLQPRTSAFTLRLTDATATLGPDRRTASVVLTAEFITRGGGEDSIDARELSVALIRPDAEWRIARLTVVEAFR